MERFLNWLDRRLGRHVPAGLPLWMVGLWGASFLLLYAKPELVADFILSRDHVQQGEVWRLVTFLLLPPTMPGGVFSLVVGGPAARASIAMAVLNYGLFFGAHLVDLLRGKARVLGRARPHKSDAFAPRPARRARVCARCGKSEADDPRLEFRVCDC